MISEILKLFSVALLLEVIFNSSYCIEGINNIIMNSNVNILDNINI